MGQRLTAIVPRAALFALAVSIAGCGSAADTDTFEVSGVIAQLIGPQGVGDPIPNATVTFRSDTLLVATTTADNSGRYRLRVTTDYPFGQVRAEAEGFEPAETTVFFDAAVRRVDLQLRAAR